MPFPSQNDLYIWNVGSSNLVAQHPFPVHRINRALSTLTLIGLMLAGVCAGAQSTQAGGAAPSTTKNQVHPHSSHSKKHPKAATKAIPATVQPAPPLPPVQQTAQQPKIQFTQGTLSIDAQNSSLKEILDQVSHQTGIEIEGLDHDERIYGQYGPDTVANTLTDLLDGSGYNYVMIGGGDDSPPTKLLLTANTGGSAPGSAAPANPTPPAANAAPTPNAPPTNGQPEA